MIRSAISPVAAAVALVAAGGCSIAPSTNVGFTYYFYGPEETLEYLDASEIPDDERALLDLERAMALLELGHYEESSAALARAELVLVGQNEDASVGTADRSPVPWLPELHERVLLSTLQIANELALQEIRDAAAAADRAVVAIDQANCERCRFDFTRVLAAFAYGEVGRFGDGLETLPETGGVGRGEDLLAGLRSRFERGIAGSQPEGLAPPPVAGERTLVVVLFLGRGPFKDYDRLDVGNGKTIRWCRYLPRDPQAVTWASAEIEDPEISVDLTDVEDLAVASLRHRSESLIASSVTTPVPGAGDIRHWASLPASLQILAFEAPPPLDAVDLVYYSPEGYEIDRETIVLPEGWIGGRLYVTRRMP